MEEGLEHLDIGCGWGALSMHSAQHFKTKVTGITLAQEQKNFIEDRKKERGIKDEVTIKVMNAWDIPSGKNDKKYDRITNVEMSEHIGIKQ